MKVEVSSMGTNIRYIVTSLTDFRTRDLYEKGYCARGSMELRIKDHKLYLKSDRSSCTKFTANQFRLFLHSTPELIKNAIQVSIDEGVQGIAVKHYDGSPFSLLRAVRNGLSETGVKGFTPHLGMEVENMTLSGYTKDIYKNEQCVQTLSTGTATSLFNYPTGVYNVIISYADEKNGHGTLTMFVANKQRLTFKLSEDVGVWRRKAFSNIKIKNGDEIKIVGIANGSEAARVDYIEFIKK